MGETYVDGAGANYSPLCVQPMMVLTAGRARLNTFVQRANQRGVPVALYIEDMFATGHDAANRETVMAEVRVAMAVMMVMMMIFFCDRKISNLRRRKNSPR